MRPSLFSFEFHTRFFPALLWSRLHSREREGTSFIFTEGYIVFAICLVLAAVGLPNAVTSGSFMGWVVGGIGSVGMLALVGSSIGTRGDGPSYNDFLPGIFFFFIFFGITAGIFIGSLEHSFFLGLSVGLAGLILGYFIGILAGLGLQYLGWLAQIFDMLAALSIIGLIVVDLVLLLG
jgi:hypothetical protein